MKLEAITIGREKEEERTKLQDEIKSLKEQVQQFETENKSSFEAKESVIFLINIEFYLE